MLLLDVSLEKTTALNSESVESSIVYDAVETTGAQRKMVLMLTNVAPDTGVSNWGAPASLVVNTLFPQSDAHDKFSALTRQ
jgi:hypothetical protein